MTEALDAVGVLHPVELLTDVGVDGAGKGGIDCGEVKYEDGATDSPVPLAARCESLEQVSVALGELRKDADEETLSEALGEGNEEVMALAEEAQGKGSLVDVAEVLGRGPRGTSVRL